MVLHIYIYVNAQIQAYTYGPHLPIIDLDRPERLHFEKIVLSSNRVEKLPSVWTLWGVTRSWRLFRRFEFKIEQSSSLLKQLVRTYQNNRQFEKSCGARRPMRGRARTINRAMCCWAIWPWDIYISSWPVGYRCQRAWEASLRHVLYRAPRFGAWAFSSVSEVGLGTTVFWIDSIIQETFAVIHLFRSFEVSQHQLVVLASKFFLQGGRFEGMGWGWGFVSVQSLRMPTQYCDCHSYQHHHQLPSIPCVWQYWALVGFSEGYMHKFELAFSHQVEYGFWYNFGCRL